MASILALPNLPPACAGTLREASEERLLALIDQGHEDAFGEIVERYERDIRTACARRVGPDHAGDIAQQTFLQALMALRRGGGPAEAEALRPWLFLIARNCCVDHLRASGPETLELSHAIDGVPQPPQIFEQRDRVRRTVDLLQVLPHEQRRALVARELEGRSYDEISAELGTSDGSVRQMIFRARAAVRRGVAALIPLPRVLMSVRGSESAPALISPHGEAVLGCIVAAIGGCAPLAAVGAGAAGVEHAAAHRDRPAVVRKREPRAATHAAPRTSPTMSFTGPDARPAAGAPHSATRRHPSRRAAPVHRRANAKLPAPAALATPLVTPEKAKAPAAAPPPAAEQPPQMTASTMPEPPAPAAESVSAPPPAAQADPPVTASSTVTESEPSDTGGGPGNGKSKNKGNGNGNGNGKSKGFGRSSAPPPAEPSVTPADDASAPTPDPDPPAQEPAPASEPVITEEAATPPGHGPKSEGRGKGHGPKH